MYNHFLEFVSERIRGNCVINSIVSQRRVKSHGLLSVYNYNWHNINF